MDARLCLMTKRHNIGSIIKAAKRPQFHLVFCEFREETLTHTYPERPFHGEVAGRQLLQLVQVVDHGALKRNARIPVLVTGLGQHLPRRAPLRGREWK